MAILDRDVAWKMLQAAALTYAETKSPASAATLSQAAKDWAASNAPAASSASNSAASPGGLVFPPYGRSKGMPIENASRQDLEFYANGCRRSLADESKARWHDKERALLEAIETEMSK